MARGISETRGGFKRAYDEDELDASLLALPLVGFVDADDPIMVKTIDAICEELVVDGFVIRYATDVVDDGLPPGEGTFLMCSFWLVNCLVLLGRLDEAEELFERCAGVNNDLGLLAEQFDPRAGRLLGNFPQAFSHVALVTSGMALQTAGQTSAIKRGT